MRTTNLRRLAILFTALYLGFYLIVMPFTGTIYFSGTMVNSQVFILGWLLVIPTLLGSFVAGYASGLGKHASEANLK